MEIKWFLEESEYERFKREQQKYMPDGKGEGNHIGTVRIENICFDIMDWGDHLLFEMYINDDYIDICSFIFNEDLVNTTFLDFKTQINHKLIDNISKINEESS